MNREPLHQLDVSQAATVRDLAADARFGRPELVALLREIIRAEGPITFDRFMDLALYAPGLGYYAVAAKTSPGHGPSADFQTSPQVHPLFGRLLARELRRVWDALGRPEPYVIVEPGAGDCELARQILDGLAEDPAVPSVRYHAIDVRVPGVTRDDDWDDDSTAGSIDVALPGTVKSSYQLSGWRQLSEFSGQGIQAHCVISNEFFDALPLHRFASVGGVLREIYVDWSGSGFVDRLGDVSDPALERWVRRYGRLPDDGGRSEACPRIEPVLSQVAALLDRGVILTVDYGYGEEDSAVDDVPSDTLVAYHRQQWSDEIYRRVGEQDLTCHVDFRAFRRIGERFGLEEAGATTQRELLRRLGLASAVEDWVAREATPARRWQARLNAAELVRLDGLGRLKVVALKKGLPNYQLTTSVVTGT